MNLGLDSVWYKAAVFLENLSLSLINVGVINFLPMMTRRSLILWSLNLKSFVSHQIVPTVELTWITLLSCGLSCLIYWFKQDVLWCSPKCFKKFADVNGTKDCTKPKNFRKTKHCQSPIKNLMLWIAIENFFVYSLAKFRLYQAVMEGQLQLPTETCGILKKLNFGDNLIAHKRFKI